MTVGVAGLGRMGTAIAQRLMQVGHQVTVWNRNAAKSAPLVDAGAAVAVTPARLASAADTIITMLSDAAAIDAVYGGPDGLLAGDVRDKLFVEMSTVEAATAIAVAEKVRARGAAFVECPVGGTVGPARAGQLLGLLGAAPVDADRAQPLLRQLCRRVEHCGPVGAGATMKLAINLPLMVSWVAYGEAFALCRELGFDGQRLLDLFTDTSGATNGLKQRAALVAALVDGRDTPGATFTVASGLKDLRTMLAQGRAHGVDLPLTEAALAAFDAASDIGWGERDASAQAVYWSKRGQR